MGLPFIKLQQHTLNHGGTNSKGGGSGRDGAGGCGRYRGPAEGRGGVVERESVTCVMEATLLLGSKIFKERS